MVEAGIMMLAVEAVEALDKRLDRFSDLLHHQSEEETTSGVSSRFLRAKRSFGWTRIGMRNVFPGACFSFNIDRR